MKVVFKRFRTTSILLGALLILMQVLFAFVSIFLSLDKMVDSTASSLLTSTNSEIKENLDQHFNRMMRIGHQVATNEDFVSYSRTESTLPEKNKREKELSLGSTLKIYSSLDTFCDSGLVFSDGTYLGNIDNFTLNKFKGQTLYDTFSNLSDEDSENFITGNEQDYSRIYYAKRINSTTVFLCSILRTDLAPIFYSAEENFNLVLHVSTPEHHVIYSGDDNESVNGVLETDLSQAIENSSHLSTALRGTYIASDQCLNGWRVTTTIKDKYLTGESGKLRGVYFIVSGLILGLSVFFLVMLILSVRRRLDEFEQLQANLEDYPNMKDINLNG